MARCHFYLRTEGCLQRGAFLAPLWWTFLSIFFSATRKEYGRRRQIPLRLLPAAKSTSPDRGGLFQSLSQLRLQLPLHKGAFKHLIRLPFGQPPSPQGEGFDGALRPQGERHKKTGAAKRSACFLFHVKQFTCLLFAYIAIPLFFVAMLHNFKTVCLQSSSDFLFSSVNDA